MDSFERFKQLMSSINFDPAVVVGVVAFILTFIIEGILIHKGYFKSNGRKKRMEKAIKLNHVIHARRISKWDDYISGQKTPYDTWCYAKYEYELNGKKKQYRYMSRLLPPFQLDLYYLNNPNKVFHYEEKKSSILDVFIFIIPFAVAGLVMYLLGFRG